MHLYIYAPANNEYTSTQWKGTWADCEHRIYGLNPLRKWLEIQKVSEVQVKEVLQVIFVQA